MAIRWVWSQRSGSFVRNKIGLSIQGLIPFGSGLESSAANAQTFQEGAVLVKHDLGGVPLGGSLGPKRPQEMVPLSISKKCATKIVKEPLRQLSASPLVVANGRLDMVVVGKHFTCLFLVV